jgi:glutaredoxin
MRTEKEMDGMDREKRGTGKITLYTLPYCMHCKVLKSTLDKIGVPYTDVDVEEKEKMGDWLEDNLKTESYPIIYYERVPGEYVYILSKTNLESLSNVRIFTTIEQALEILLKYYYEI